MSINVTTKVSIFLLRLQQKSAITILPRTIANTITEQLNLQPRFLTEYVKYQVKKQISLTERAVNISTTVRI